MSRGWSMNEVAKIAAQDIPDGAYVNLGIGLPEQIADYLPVGRDVVLHSENGILGMGPKPPRETQDPDLINAGKKPVTLLAGGAYFHHADSFAMIRGGHIDICVMGAFQVSAAGDLANWSAGDEAVPAIGGAMDLAVSAKSVRIIMRHQMKDGGSKLVASLSLPVTARGVVKLVYTDQAVLRPASDCFEVLLIAPGYCETDLIASTQAPLRFSDIS